MPAKKKTKAASSSSRYKAPALEKGLEILELLATEPGALSMPNIAKRLSRSSGEIFRMIQVLETMGYIGRSEDGDGYTITDRLFMLGMEQPKIKELSQIAYPVMQRLSSAIGQSCHLAVASLDQIVVVQRVESTGEIGFSVRVGYRRLITEATSGIVLFAFQPEEIRDAWLARLGKSGTKTRLDDFVARSKAVRKRGFEKARSDFVDGIVDLSAPILRADACQAALTVPFVHYKPLIREMNDAIPYVRQAATDLSNAITFGESAGP